jgi:putative membrane protein
MFRKIVCIAGVLLAGSSADAQIGNPAVMGVDTRMARPGEPAPHQTNNQDRLFAQLVAAGCLAEVELGKLATGSAKADAVRQFGDMMVREHSEANQKLTGFADADNIPLPTKLDAEHVVVRDRLQRLKDGAFDIAYIKAQIVDHQKTAQLLAWEISMGEDGDMQRLAASLLSIVLDHLRQAQEINATLTGASVRLLPEKLTTMEHKQ